MDKISRILVADDLVREDKGRPSEVLNLAIGLAERLGAEVRLLHVYDLPGIAVAPGSLDRFELPYVEAMGAALETEASAIRAGRPGLKIVSSVAKGPTVEVLLRSIRELDCQLVVLGTQAAGRLRRGALGSVAESMLGRAQVPLLTVGPHVHHRPPGLMGHIVVAIDFSPTMPALINAAVHFAELLGSEITLVHVLEEWAYPIVQSASLLLAGSATAMPLERHLEARASQRFSQLEELADSLRKERRDLVIKIRLVERTASVSAGINDAARKSKADLVVIGHRHRRPIQDTVWGSNSRSVVRESRCPVLSLSSAAIAEYGLHPDVSSGENSFMYHTKNTLDQKIRFESIALLQDRLSNGLDLLAQTKQAHWNVKGENFIALHKLFDKVYDASGEWVDLLAERIVQLGGEAAGTIRATERGSKLPDYPSGLISGEQHVNALSASLAFFGELIRLGIDQTGQIGDAASCDIFTQILRSVDKFLWMVEAHNQAGQAASLESAA